MPPDLVAGKTVLSGARLPLEFSLPAAFAGGLAAGGGSAACCIVASSTPASMDSSGWTTTGVGSAGVVTAGAGSVGDGLVAFSVLEQTAVASKATAAIKTKYRTAVGGGFAMAQGYHQMRWRQRLVLAPTRRRKKCLVPEDWKNKCRLHSALAERCHLLQGRGHNARCLSSQDGLDFRQ